MKTVGDTAPDFDLLSGKGRRVRLSDLRGQNVVLFFYPKDETPGCTKEVCGFRDGYQEFATLGAALFGISSDGPSSHAGFARKHDLPFELLADKGGRVRSAYGVRKTLGIMPGRATFIIDGQGMIRGVFSSQFQPLQHVDEALSVLRALKEPKADAAAN